MTKYILESGSIKKYPDKGRVFFEEALQDLGSTPTILWCFFAMDPEEREARFRKYCDIADAVLPKYVSARHVHAHKNTFIEQVADADVVQLQGGNTAALLKELSEYNLESLFNGKVIAGHSAGSNVLCDSYWSPGMRKLGKGFRLLPCKFISHFNSDYESDDPRGPIDWTAAKKAIEEYGDQSLPVYALEEGDFVVFEK